VISNAIARRYAKALVQLGAENNLLEQFTSELEAVDRVIAGSSELYSLLSDPAFTVVQKKEVMRELATKLGCCELVSNFLLLLVDKGRIICLPQIVSTYKQLADEQAGVIRPLIKSAMPLDDGQLAALSSALESRTGKKVIPEIVVDQTLLGGVVTQIGDIVYDCSVKTQLERINDILQKG